MLLEDDNYCIFPAKAKHAEKSQTWLLEAASLLFPSEYLLLGTPGGDLAAHPNAGKAVGGKRALQPSSVLFSRIPNQLPSQTPLSAMESRAALVLPPCLTVGLQESPRML